MIFKQQKFSLRLLLSFCLIFCQFQSCIAYESVAYKKACIYSINREMLEMLGNSMRDTSKGISKRKIFINKEELRHHSLFKLQGFFQHFIACGTCTQCPFREMNNLFSVKTIEITFHLGLCSIPSALNLETLEGKSYNCTILLNVTALFHFTTHMFILSRISPELSDNCPWKCLNHRYSPNNFHERLNLNKLQVFEF